MATQKPFVNPTSVRGVAQINPDYGIDEYALSPEEVEDLHACIRENDIAAVSSLLYRTI